MFKLYSQLLVTHPLKTKALTAGLVFSLGDCLTQNFIQKNEKFDFRRNLNFFITGSCYFGPCLHMWYSKILPRLIKAITGNTTSGASGTMLQRIKYAIPGTLLDQLVCVPPFLTGFYIFSNWVKHNFTMEGFNTGVEQAKLKIKRTVLTNWKIWPTVTMINLMFVPIQFRVLFSNFVGIFWNMYLSWMSSLKMQPL